MLDRLTTGWTATATTLALLVAGGAVAAGSAIAPGPDNRRFATGLEGWTVEGREPVQLVLQSGRPRAILSRNTSLISPPTLVPEAAQGVGVLARAPRGRALLYRGANRQTVPTARAAVLQKAFELGRADGQLLLLVRLYNGILRELPVSADLAWFAGEAATGLLAMGERDAAQPWLSLLRERRLRDRDARAARDRLWSLAVLAGDPRYAIDDGEAFRAWLAVLRE